jgi:hypothetical protein
MAAAEYRLRAGHPDFGPCCPSCAGPKNLQARRCVRCYRESLRTVRFWLLRTCGCGGPKSNHSERCLQCEHQARRVDGSRFAVSLPQPVSHPWRDRRAA